MKYIVVFLACACAYLLFMYNHAKTNLSYAESRINALDFDNKALRGNNDILQKEITQRNENALALGERIKYLEEEAVKINNTGGFKWGAYLPDDTITHKLRKN